MKILINKIRNNIGLRGRIFSAGVLPALLISALLGYYYIASWNTNANERLQINGARYSEDLAKLGEFPLFTHDVDFLSALAGSLFSDNDVYSVSIMDNKKAIIIHETSPLYVEEVPDNSLDDEMIFLAAVHGGQLSIIKEDEFFNGGDSATYPDLFGWVQVVMTEAYINESRYEMLTNTLLILSAVIVTAFLLALFLAGHITRPLIHLKDNVNKMASGDMPEKAIRKNSGSNELDALENSFHDMATAVKNSQFELQKKIDIAIASHLNTITHLEKNNVELIKARETMQLAVEEKSEFLARMSHEIRTPIHSIMGFVKLISRTSLNDKQSEYVRIVDQASEHLLQLINDVLKISSMQTNSIKLENENINIRECIEDVALLMSPAAHKKGLELVFLFDSDVPVDLIGDQYHLKQIIINLVGNAIKFTARGDVVISVSLLNEGIDSAKLSINVSDTGIGIAPDQICNIQNPFFQADTSKRREQEGVGLGLAIVKTLTGMMGGSLSVNSDPGKGSKFYCVLELEKQKGAASTEHHGDLQDKKILCFDAHPVALRSVRNQVLAWTGKVYTAATLDRVEELLRGAEDNDQPFDLLIAGVNKKQSDSEVFKHKLRSIKNTFSGKLLILIGDEGNHRCMSLSKDDDCVCITKPVSHLYLYKKIESIFDQHKVMPQNDRVAVDDISGETHHEKSLGIKILLAEDNDFNRLYVSSLMTDRGFEVIEAVTGLEALHLAKQEKFDLIIMDIHLPEMDGIEVSSKIKNDVTPNSETMIIALTADVYINENAKLNAVGISGVINKPVNEVEFNRSLNKYLAAKLTDSDEKEPAQPSNDIPLGNLDNIKKRLLPRLVDELPDHNKRIYAAFISGDRAGLAEHLHQLKGVAGYFQLSGLSTVASQADEYVRSDEQLKLDELRPFIQRIDEKIQAILASEFV